jgi:hypothetical protein
VTFIYGMTVAQVAEVYGAAVGEIKRIIRKPDRVIRPLGWAFLRLARRLKEKRHVGTWRCRGITPSRAKTGWTGLISFNDRCRDFGELREVILQARKLAVADIEKHQRDVPTSELLAA